MSDYPPQKTYYMETNALYALSNHFDAIANSNMKVATSIFALQEIVDGVDAGSFHRRKVLLNKLCSSSVTIYPYLPKECITTAFHLDVSARPQILDEKAALLEQIKLIRSSESFSVYCNRSANELGIDVIAARKSDDQREQENKRIISKEIESDRIYIRKLRKEQAEHPSYIQIDPIKAFSLHTDVPDINLHSDEAKLLQSVLDSLLITYEEQDLRDIMLQKDPDALVAFFLGCQLYGGAKALELDRKLAGHNDVNDLIHLLYLRNRDSLIVSEDTIFDISSMGDMRIKNDAFLELIQKFRFY